MFGALGAFFTTLGVYGQFATVPAILSLGLQPLAMIAVGIPLIAATFVLQLLHRRRGMVERAYPLSEAARRKRGEAAKGRCQKCGAVNEEGAEYCTKCGSLL